MMKITLFALIISAGILTSCNVNAKYRKQGNHWFEDGTLPNGKEDAKLFVNEGLKKYEDLFMLHDAAAMAEKYTEDCVYMHQDIGIIEGREAVREAYQEMFDSGKYSVEILKDDYLELLVLETGGYHGYMQVKADVRYFDKDNNSMGVSRILVTLKPVEDGFQTYQKTEFTFTE
ncbi:uncharacterized protein [Amphiura filiformis]|uniref:uncharacterized protein isoform X2 n=1 Tax=Amphiura filiformis TaxID=82378 RepID=UPI003B21B7A2